jgi:acetyl esterase/lipase
MPPDGYFPCAHDDVFAAYKAALKRCDASRLAVFGTSAGGALTLSLVQRAIAEKLPVPGAICSGTPMSDVVKRGDTFLTNETLDNVLVSRDGFCDTMTRLYANGLDLSDPRLSPIHGDFCGFPPTMLISGTRDLLLSNTVRVHRKLRQAGVEAALNVFEAMAHAQYLFDRRAPETREAFAEMATFFDRRLAV